MKHLLSRLASWVLRCCGCSLLPLLPEVQKVVRRARVLCAEQDERCALGTSGEYKRHEVYARLLKEFPEVRKRNVALAIEVALC